MIGELNARGFTVATFDWRGQGGSARLLADPLKAHARDFERPSFFTREPLEGWRALGGRDLRAAAAARVASSLASYQAPDDLDPIVRRQLDDYCLG